MLILTRKVGEAIFVGDNIVFTVSGVKGGQTKIGIEAPKDISVHREEIYKKLLDEQSQENFQKTKTKEKDKE